MSEQIQTIGINKTNQSGITTVCRNSNLELYRIIVMLVIVAHHYVVNSGLSTVMYESPLAVKSIILFIFGAWGKTGINCFVLITGYFMCRSHITARKFFKLLFEVYFYKIIFYAVFTLTGYQHFSLTTFIQTVLPFSEISHNFTDCYILFYLCIPFLNVLIRNLKEKQHIFLLCLVFTIYVFFGTMPGLNVTMNYVSWFICLYFVGAYIRFYPKKIYDSTTFWGLLTLVIFVVASASVVLCLWLGTTIERKIAYQFVSDSNTFLAVALGITSFLFFKNLKIKQSKFINTVAASTFGVLLIHANSDAMRNWLWSTVLNNVGMYESNLIYIHAIASVLGVFIVASIIDIIRTIIIEKPFLDLVDNTWNRLIKRFQTKNSRC